MYITLLSHSLTTDRLVLQPCYNIPFELISTTFLWHTEPLHYQSIRHTPYDTHEDAIHPTLLNTIMIPKIRHSFLRHYNDYHRHRYIHSLRTTTTWVSEHSI